MTAPADIEPDVLDIVAVVLGAEPVPLDKPARIIALGAMNALGYSTTYMAEQLGISPRSLPSLASALKVRLNRYREFVDARAVEFVLQGTPMALRGNDMDAALTQLAQRGKSVVDCARLLRTSTQTVHEHADKLGLTLAEADEGCWWNRYYDTAPGARTEK